MDPYSRTDAQFNRAVEIVQNLPKTGPIQTGYEDKLSMYGLYKQATMGDVSGPRPAMWEVLPRAKWDAWAKHKGMDSHEAKRMYVDALLKVLRRYSDKTIAMDYVRELESYYSDMDLAMRASFTRSRRSSSSSSASSQPGPSGTRYATEPAYVRGSRTDVQNSALPSSYAHIEEPSSQEETTSASEGEDEDELADQVRQPLPPPPPVSYPPTNRPHSSLSSKRYRTPMASMLMTPPVASMSVPPTQPMPRHETPSAYADVGRASPSTYPTTSVSYPLDQSQSSRTDPIQSPDLYPVPSPYRPSSQPQYTGRPYALQASVAPRPVLERAVENVQMHLAALTERIESLENMAHRSTTSLTSQGGSRSPRYGSYNRGVSPLGAPHEPYTFDDMGMWSIVLNPLAVVALRFQRLMEFLMYNDNRSPTLVVVRRLMLDISFLLCVLGLLRFSWRRSGVRRKEVLGALKGLWYALVGQKAPRVLVDRGV